MSAPSTEVGPGFLAFVVFFFLAVVLWLLMRASRRRSARTRSVDASGATTRSSCVQMPFSR